MILRKASDIHNEFGDKSYVLPPLDTDPESILILAGDLDTNGRIIKKGRTFPGDIKPTLVLEEYSERFLAVIVVLGNHDFWGGSIDTMNPRLKGIIAERGLNNVHLLDNDLVEIGGVTFMGATLWTDYNNLNPESILFAESYMNDFRKIRFRTTRKIKSASTFYTEHHRARKYIEIQASKVDGPVVVVTHHAPTPISIDMKYRNDFHANGSYASDLTDVMLNNRNIKIWFHGHIHCSSDYYIGDTRVICNPRGYEGYEINPVFNPFLQVEIDGL